MSRSEAEDRAIKKYEKEKIDKILVRFPKGKKADIQKHIEETRESINAFINRAVEETMVRDEQEQSGT